MSQPRSTQHATLVIERAYLASPARVFAAWATVEAKARWFCGPADLWTEKARELDFRVGGREVLVGAFTGGSVSTFESRYQDIVPDQRIVYSYDMHIDDARISVSLATVEFKVAGAGTQVVVTEQGSSWTGSTIRPRVRRGPGRCWKTWTRRCCARRPRSRGGSSRLGPVRVADAADESWPR